MSDDEYRTRQPGMLMQEDDVLAASLSYFERVADAESALRVRMLRISLALCKSDHRTVPYARHKVKQN